MGQREQLAQAGYRLPASYFSEGGGSIAAVANPSDLATDFPGRKELIAAGLTTREAVGAKTDEELDAISGIGPATVAEIRAALK